MAFPFLEGRVFSLSYTTAHRSRKQAVYGQFHFLAIAVEGCGEVLQEAGEAEQRSVQRGFREGDPSSPLAEFAAVGDA
ncbi:MAG: hypothetical protein FJ303_19045 [Planctomycetes bacterium]|nr:hypothetical protein [Planctomycetota bacterium]